MSAAEIYRPKCALTGCYKPVRDSRQGRLTKYCSDEHYQTAKEQKSRDWKARGRTLRLKGPQQNIEAISGRKTEQRQNPLRLTHRLTTDRRVAFQPPADALPPRRDEHGFIAAYQDDVWATLDHGSPGMARHDVGWARMSAVGSIAGEGV